MKNFCLQVKKHRAGKRQKKSKNYYAYKHTCVCAHVWIYVCLEADTNNDLTTAAAANKRSEGNCAVGNGNNH